MHAPSLKFLKTFHIAAKRGSFKAAAAELCVTASAVSHQIKALEQQLGVSLFDRGPRSLSLTAAGATYLENIDAVFSRLESVTNSYSDVSAEPSCACRYLPFLRASCWCRVCRTSGRCTAISISRSRPTSRQTKSIRRMPTFPSWWHWPVVRPAGNATVSPGLRGSLFPRAAATGTRATTRGSGQRAPDRA